MKKVFYVMEINPNGHYKKMIDVWSTRQKAVARANELNRGREGWIERNFIHKVYQAEIDPDLAMLADVAKKVAWFAENVGRGTLPRGADREVIEMAQGGTAGNIRAEYYINRSDRYFQLVCEGMGWEWRK